MERRYSWQFTEVVRKKGHGWLCTSSNEESKHTYDFWSHELPVQIQFYWTCLSKQTRLDRRNQLNCPPIRRESLRPLRWLRYRRVGIQQEVVFGAFLQLVMWGVGLATLLYAVLLGFFKRSYQAQWSLLELNWRVLRHYEKCPEKYQRYWCRNLPVL